MPLYDTDSLHEFLSHTPEGGLRKMLIDGQSLTEVHFNLLLKIVRATSVDAFHTHFTNADYPRIRMSPAEDKIKERFWANCVATLSDRGLLQAIARGDSKAA
jgi:hypothetical protein